MSGQSSPKIEGRPQKEITEIKKIKTEEITTEFDMFLLINEALLNGVEKEGEQESDLDIRDGFVDTLGSTGKEIIELFQREVDELEISKGAKIALKTLSKLVLGYKKFKKVKTKLKIC